MLFVPEKGLTENACDYYIVFSSLVLPKKVFRERDMKRSAFSYNFKRSISCLSSCCGKKVSLSHLAYYNNWPAPFAFYYTLNNSILSGDRYWVLEVISNH